MCFLPVAAVVVFFTECTCITRTTNTGVRLDVTGTAVLAGTKIFWSYCDGCSKGGLGGFGRGGGGGSGSGGVGDIGVGGNGSGIGIICDVLVVIVGVVWLEMVVDVVYELC